jgi:hypothetical protein
MNAELENNADLFLACASPLAIDLEWAKKIAAFLKNDLGMTYAHHQLRHQSCSKWRVFIDREGNSVPDHAPGQQQARLLHIAVSFRGPFTIGIGFANPSAQLAVEADLTRAAPFYREEAADQQANELAGAIAKHFGLKQLFYDQIASLGVPEKYQTKSALAFLEEDPPTVLNILFEEFF